MSFFSFFLLRLELDLLDNVPVVVHVELVCADRHLELGSERRIVHFFVKVALEGSNGKKIKIKNEALVSCRF